MIRGWLSREGRPPAPVRVTGTPLAVMVTDMPPRPPEGRPQPAEDIWGIGAATVVNPDRRFDPCGAPPITTKKAAMRTGRGT